MESPVILWYQPDTAPFNVQSPDFSSCRQALSAAGVERVDCHHASQLLTLAGQLARRYSQKGVLPRVVVVMCAGMAENTALACLLRSEQPQTGIAALVPDLQEETQLLALQSGVDCWFTGTSSPRLVMAIVFGLTRRMGCSEPVALSGAPAQGWRLIGHGWQLKSPDGTVIDLSTAERDLMMTLACAPEHHATYQQLLAVPGNQAGKNEEGRRVSLTVMVSRMKKKCEALGVELPVKALHRRGYMFNGTLGLADASQG